MPVVVPPGTGLVTAPPPGALPEDPAATRPGLARRFPLRAFSAMRRILLGEADTHRSARELLGQVNHEIVRRAHRVLELTLPGARESPEPRVTTPSGPGRPSQGQRLTA